MPFGNMFPSTVGPYPGSKKTSPRTTRVGTAARGKSSKGARSLGGAADFENINSSNGGEYGQSENFSLPPA
jgi:hypothetical protein